MDLRFRQTGESLDYHFRRPLFEQFKKPSRIRRHNLEFPVRHNERMLLLAEFFRFPPAVVGEGVPCQLGNVDFSSKTKVTKSRGERLLEVITELLGVDHS